MSGNISPQDDRIAPTAGRPCLQSWTWTASKVAIADSDVEDYPGLWFRGTGGNALTAAFPPYPLKENSKVIATSKSPRPPITLQSQRALAAFPWRLMGIAERTAT